MKPSSAAMITRAIPSTGEALPVIGLGTWQAFDVGGGAATRRTLAEVLRLFFAGGAKIIDSSPMYGRAERVAGHLLTELDARESAFMPPKPWTSGREAVIVQVERSAALCR